MRKWVRIHRRDQIFPSILDSAPKEVVQVGTGRLFLQVRMAKVRSCGRKEYLYWDLVRQYSHEELGTS